MPIIRSWRRHDVIALCWYVPLVSWFFLSTLNYDARSTTHQIFMSISSLCVICRLSRLTAGRVVEKTHILLWYILNTQIWSSTICHFLYTRWLTALCRTSRSITMFTTPRYLCVSSPRLISSMPSHSISLTFQRGVTGTARMLHALTHSSISRQVREQM